MKGKKSENKAETKRFSFPASVLAPIRSFLSREERRLAKRKEELERQDPFADVRRVSDNAAVDSEAAEQAGHERVFALRRGIERKLIQIRKALTRIKIDKYGLCEECGRMIDTERLMVMPEATVCVECEKKKEE